MKIWDIACEMAARTPQERNRYVDFLRAVSILVVIAGHWLITTVYYADGALTAEHVFRVQPQTRWLTWIFQVMPVFFIVGGYANAVSLESARRKRVGYAEWLAGRLHRLIVPLLALILFWAVIAVIMHAAGVDQAQIGLASQAALIPTWFLAIYIMVVILAPVMHRLWLRLGFASLFLLIALAVLTDLAFFGAGIRWLGWGNYFWVWLAIHSLGFAWRDGRLGSPAQLLVLAASALLILWLLVFYGPYPLAMVGSPGQALSNNTPPKITLLALALFQFGLLLALEQPMRRALAGLRLWAAAVLINSMIMTIYLWHVTVMIILIILLYLAGGAGLGLEPGSGAWWLSRPLWEAVLAVLLVPLALLLSPLERSSRNPEAAVASPLRQVAGAAMVCLGVALLAMFGYGGGPIQRLDLASFTLVVGGAICAGMLSGIARRGR